MTLNSTNNFSTPLSPNISYQRFEDFHTKNGTDHYL